MTESASPVIERSYGCTFGCGNPYDYVVVDVASGESMMLCTPCFVKTAIDVVHAITNQDSPEVQNAVAVMGLPEQTPMTGSPVKKRGHNAPAGTTEPSIISDYDGVITVDELPPEFK